MTNYRPDDEQHTGASGAFARSHGNAEQWEEKTDATDGPNFGQEVYDEKGRYVGEDSESLEKMAQQAKTGE